MKIYILKTTIGGKTTEQKLSDGKPIQIQAQQDAQYELVDENSNILQSVKEQDTLKWLNPENEEVLVQIEHYQPSKLAAISESPSITSEAIQVKSAVLASEVGVGKAVLWGLGGLLTAGGIALAASGGKGGGGSANNQKAAEKPTNNTVTENSNLSEPSVVENVRETTPSEAAEKSNPPTTDEPYTAETTTSSTERNETATETNDKTEPSVVENVEEIHLLKQRKNLVNHQ